MIPYSLKYKQYKPDNIYNINPIILASHVCSGHLVAAAPALLPGLGSITPALHGHRVDLCGPKYPQLGV